MTRKTKYKYNIGELVKYDGQKAQIITRFWDEHTTNRYEIRFVIGKNLTGCNWMVTEHNLEKYEK